MNRKVEKVLNSGKVLKRKKLLNRKNAKKVLNRKTA